MLWSEFLTALDEARSQIRANRDLKAQIDWTDSIIDATASLFIGRVDPRLTPVEAPPIIDTVQMDATDAQTVKKWETPDGCKVSLPPRKTKLVIRPPVLEETTEENLGKD